MTVNSVTTGLRPPSNSLFSGNSRTARSGAPSFTSAGPSQAAGADIKSVAPDTSVPGSDAADFQFRSNFERAPREEGSPSESSSSGTTGSIGGRSSPGIALYQRINQYGNSKPSTSALLESWNNIMQGGQDTDSAATAFAKRLLQNETPGSESGVIDLTA